MVLDATERPNHWIQRPMSHRAAGRLAALLIVGGLAFAASEPPAAAEDPPSRVGSLNYISGEVRFAVRSEAGEPAAADSLPWKDADFDQPVCQDMSLATGPMARARIRIGPDAIQMSNDTVLNMLNLTDQLIEASVRQGRIHLQLNKLAADESVELEIPRGSLWLLQDGAYDIAVGGAEEPTRIVVFAGQARFVGGQTDVPIAAGQEIDLTGSYPDIVATGRPAATPASATPRLSTDAAAPAIPAAAAAAPTADSAARAQTDPAVAAPSATPASSEAPVPADGAALPTRADGAAAPPTAAAPAQAEAQNAPSDDFLYWVEQSQDSGPPPQAARYVSDGATGYDELDRYGTWQTLPDSEAVWFPTSVPPDWAPYRFGHWDWIPPWGWTWIDDEPWGFAPFHYGRWANIAGRWGWLPGAVVADPVYAPALVAFVDPPSGPDGPPDVGWFPLGPGDVFVPWYAAGPAYVERLNVVTRQTVRVTAVTHDVPAWRAHFANRRFATVVRSATFAGAHPVQHGLVRVPPERLQHAAVRSGAPRITPAAFRPPAHGEPPRGGAAHAMPVSAGAGSLRGRPQSAGSAAEREPLHRAPRTATEPIARSRASEPAPPSPRPQYRRPEFSRGEAPASRGNVPRYGTPENFRNQAGRYGGGMQTYQRPETFRNQPTAFGGRTQQYGQPMQFRTPQPQYGGVGLQMGRGIPQSVARPAPVHIGGSAPQPHHK